MTFAVRSTASWHVFTLARSDGRTARQNHCRWPRLTHDWQCVESGKVRRVRGCRIISADCATSNGAIELDELGDNDEQCTVTNEPTRNRKEGPKSCDAGGHSSE